MPASEKQRLYIASLVEQNREEYPTLEGIWNELPKPKDIDNRQLLFAEKLKILTGQQANYIISSFTKAKGYSMSTAFKILLNV